MQNNMILKCLIFSIILLFIYSSFIGSTMGFSIDKSQMFIYEGNTLYVGGGGSGNYSNIQDAIDNASDGDTVFVFDDSSPYYENLIVTKGIFLIGENKDTTIIDGSGDSNVIYIDADNVFVSGFTIQNGVDYVVLNPEASANGTTTSGYALIEFAKLADDDGTAGSNANTDNEPRWR